MFKKTGLIVCSIAAFALMFNICDIADAQRRGGGFSSSRSSSSRSWSSSKSNSWGSKKTTTNKSTFGSSSRTSSAKKTTATRSPAQQKAYNKAKSSGKAYTSKSEALSAFKTKNAEATKAGGKYTSQYKTKPETRPEHIPQTYKAQNGTTYNITYNQNSGGYGYWNGGGPGLGTFIMYDVMSDAIILNHLMSKQGYYYDQPPVVQSVRTQNSLSWVAGFFVFLFIFALFLFFVTR